MLKEYEKKTNIGIGLGIVLQLVARFGLMSQSNVAIYYVGLAVALGGIALCIWGCCCYAKGKGHHPAWGILGLLSLIGLIVLVCFSDRHKQTKQ
jgi:hypothetical protein